MQAEAQEQEVEEVTSVEIEDDSEVIEESSEEQQASSDEDSDDEQELRDYESPNKKKKDPQRRIKHLTALRKKAEEEAAAAVEYAQQVKAQNDEYKKRLSTLDKGYMSEYEGRVTTQEAQAKRALAEAHEAGDYEKLADAQSAISQIAIEKERLRLQKQRSEQQAQEYAAQQEQVQQQPRQQAPQPQRDPKLESWLEKNKWFGQDKVMTGAARAIHETLVAEEGYAPTTDEYYLEIDRRMRSEMPNKFASGKKNVQSVTPSGNGSRSLVNGRKKQVDLNPGQVALASKLGIPLEKYAQEVQKLANRRD
tara:strand:+ start:1653 stop:2576 length:924 start_codon:yes stop_codon:yes gene_type:complete